MVAHLGGAVSTVATGATAFSNRDARFFYHTVLLWDDPVADDSRVAFGRSLWNALRPWSSGTYVNFLEDDERTREAYAAETYERLVALKREYDPDNVFRLNQNIKPA